MKRPTASEGHRRRVVDLINVQAQNLRQDVGENPGSYPGNEREAAIEAADAISSLARIVAGRKL